MPYRNAVFVALITITTLAFPSLVRAASSAEDLTVAAGVKSGLVLVPDCGDGVLGVNLGKLGAYVVHCLAFDAKDAEAVQKGIRDAGLMGQVQSSRWLREPTAAGGASLPYANAIANLVVVEQTSRLLGAGVNLQELVRILRPGGVLLLGGGGAAEAADRLPAGTAAGRENIAGGSYVKIIRSASAGTDDWPTLLHGVDGNPVSSDTVVAPPRTVRWAAGRPVFPVRHRKSSNLNNAIANGRIYSICPEFLQPNGKSEIRLSARDAYNGLLLWKIPLGEDFPETKKPHIKNPRDSILAPLFVVDARLYTVTDKSAVAIDSATGTLIRSYDTPMPIDQLLYKDGALLLSTSKDLRLVDATTGKTRWASAYPVDEPLIYEDTVFCLDYRKTPYDLVGFKFADGAEKLRVTLNDDWMKAAPRLASRVAPIGKSGKEKASGDDHDSDADDKDASATQAITLLLAHNGTVVLARAGGYMSRKPGLVIGASTSDGSCRFVYEGSTMHGFMSHVFGIDGRIHIEGGSYGAMSWQIVDPATGKAEQGLDIGYYPLAKCQRSTATERMFINGRETNTIDWADGVVNAFLGVRGSCRVGLLPANGLLYSNPVSCGCGSAWIRGYVALASDPPPAASLKNEDRLVAGSAMGKTSTIPASEPTDEWPAWRGGNRRLSTSAASLPVRIAMAWSAKAANLLVHPMAGDREGDFLTAPVVAGGRVVVADIDHHSLRAFHAETGAPLWTFTANGRIMGPPVLSGGVCLFGAQDGWVYCLDAANGALAWRFFAAPADRFLPIYGQLESLWPVQGGVTIMDGVAVALAGRTSQSDDGLMAWGLDPATGKVLWNKRVNGIQPQAEKGKGPKVEGFRGVESVGDLLSSDGSRLWLRNVSINPKTGTLSTEKPAPGTSRLIHNRFFSPSGLWRYYQATNRARQIQVGDGRLANGTQVIAFDASSAYTFSFTSDNNWGTPRGAAALARTDFDAVGKKAESGWKIDLAEGARYAALLKAGDRLYCAAQKDPLDSKTASLEVRSAADGALLSEVALPCDVVQDGLAAAHGRLYASLTDGRVICLAAKGEQ